MRDLEEDLRTRLYHTVAQVCERIHLMLVKFEPQTWPMDFLLNASIVLIQTEQGRRSLVAQDYDQTEATLTKARDLLERLPEMAAPGPTV